MVKVLYSLVLSLTFGIW